MTMVVDVSTTAVAIASKGCFESRGPDWAVKVVAVAVKVASVPTVVGIAAGGRCGPGGQKLRSGAR